MKTLGRILLIVLMLAVPVMFFLMAIITGEFRFVVVAIIIAIIYAFIAHASSGSKDEPSHKENFSEGLTYDEYVEKYGEPKRYTEHLKKK